MADGDMDPRFPGKYNTTINIPKYYPPSRFGEADFQNARGEDGYTITKCPTTPSSEAKPGEVTHSDMRGLTRLIKHTTRILIISMRGLCTLTHLIPH